MSRRALIIYCGFVYLASWSLQIVAVRLTGNIHSPAALPWMACGMFTPAIATIAFVVFHPAAREWLMWKPNWRMIWPLIVGVATPR